MKKLILVLVILGMGLVFAIDLSSTGQYRLWKEAENHVKVQRTITDPNGVITVVWERSYGLEQVTKKIAAAQTQVIFYDMNNADAISYVAGLKAKAIAKLNKWQAIKDKFDGALDTE